MSLLSSCATCSLSTTTPGERRQRGDAASPTRQRRRAVADVVVGASRALPAIVPPVPRTTSGSRRALHSWRNWMKIQDWMFIQLSPG